MATKALSFPVTAENKTAATFKQIKSDIGGITSKLGGMKTALVGAIGVAGFGIMAKNVLDTADKIHKLNLRLGVTPEALSELRHAADLSGVSFKALTLGMQRANRRIAEAAQGTGTAKLALEELGLEASELAQMKPEDQLAVLADALAGVTSESDRVRLAFKLFDSEGVALLQMMQGGSAGLQQMRKDARDLGLTLSQDDVNAAAAFNDSLENLRDIFEAITTDVTIGIAPALTEAANAMTDWYKANKDMIELKAAEVFERLKTTFEVLWPVLKTTAQYFYDIVDAITKATANAYTWLESNYLDAAGAQAVINELSGNTAGQPSSGASGAAGVAAGGGGSGFTGEDADLWNWGASASGTTIVNNFNGQYSRSDVANITADQARTESRQ